MNDTDFQTMGFYWFSNQERPGQYLYNINKSIVVVDYEKKDKFWFVKSVYSNLSATVKKNSIVDPEPVNLNIIEEYKVRNTEHGNLDMLQKTDGLLNIYKDIHSQTPMRDESLWKDFVGISFPPSEAELFEAL